MLLNMVDQPAKKVSLLQVGRLTASWVEHFEWLEPLFNEKLVIRGGRMEVPDRPGLGYTLSDRMRRWTVESAEFGA